MVSNLIGEIALLILHSMIRFRRKSALNNVKLVQFLNNRHISLLTTGFKIFAKCLQLRKILKKKQHNLINLQY